VSPRNRSGGSAEEGRFLDARRSRTKEAAAEVCSFLFSLSSRNSKSTRGFQFFAYPTVQLFDGGVLAGLGFRNCRMQ